jgi:hypothetical protein
MSKCLHCGEKTYRHALAKWCMRCLPRHTLQLGRAGSAVRRAVASGELENAQELACVDCGNPAFAYDHRDYLKPYDVEPVCRKCNFRRGPGKNAVA